MSKLESYLHAAAYAAALITVALDVFVWRI